MNRKILISGAVFSIMLLGSGSTKAEISKGSDGYYSLSSKADWKDFVALVNKGTETNANAKLTADINLPTESNYAATYLVGTSTYKYSGTFDGQGYTVTFTKDGLSDHVAPFSYVNGATIKNLKTAGSLTGCTGQYCAGIVAEAFGTVTIQNCASSMTITSSYTSGDACYAGIIACSAQSNGATVTVKNCLFDGSITAQQGICGIVGYFRAPATETKHTISNVLNAGTITYTNTTSLGNVYRAASGSTNTPTNAYYINKVGSSTDGTAATTDQLNIGTLAYTLNTDNTETLFWGQGGLNANPEKYPTLTTDNTKKVLKLTPQSVSTALYVNPGGALPNAARYSALGWRLQGNEASISSLPTTLTESNTLIRVYDKYLLTVTSAGATTLVLPFDADLPAGVKAYKLNYTSGETVTATSVSKITANQPVLINAEAGTYTFTVSNSSTITYSNAIVSDGALTGVYVQAGSSAAYNPIAYVPANSYVLQNNATNGLGFYQVPEDNKIRITSFRAYLTAEAVGAARLSIVFDDENATGVTNVKASMSDDDAIYTLNGTRVDQPVKGIYIKNGKKYIVK